VLAVQGPYSNHKQDKRELTSYSHRKTSHATVRIW
jgi:hypothetical protein